MKKERASRVLKVGTEVIVNGQEGIVESIHKKSIKVLVGNHCWKVTYPQVRLKEAK